jgi:hypothetical protein
MTRGFWLCALVLAAALFLCFAAALKEDATRVDELQELRKHQAIVDVQLQDARERIGALERDLDRIAPHTVGPR